MVVLDSKVNSVEDLNIIANILKAGVIVLVYVNLMQAVVAVQVKSVV